MSISRCIRILHITNHVGTIENVSNAIKYAYPDGNYNISVRKWPYSYYVSISKANEVFDYMKEEISDVDLLIFSDTPMCARPFLQNITKHTCKILIYNVNRFDWGIWGFEDKEFYNLHASSSCITDRVKYIADNRYDQYYSEKHGINFYFNDLVRLTPFIIPRPILPSSENNCKFFIQNRGTHINSYMNILTANGVEYELFGEGFQRYRDRKQICEYIGILHLPYQVNIQSLWENLGYGIIYFIPSKRFLQELVETCSWYYWEERNQNVELKAKSFELCEWYAEDICQVFEYFDSWADLANKYQKFKQLATNPADYSNFYTTRKQEILTIAHHNNRIHVEKWRQILNTLVGASNMEAPKYPITIVTMFYNIRKKDNDICDFHRKQEQFFALGSEFILQLNIPLFICMDADDTEFYEFVMNRRKELHLDHITFCFRENFEHSYFYKYINQLKTLQENFKIINGNPRHETPLYITLNNNKFYYMENAISTNPFNSTHFVWMDFGINHVAKEPQTITQWITQTPNKIKQLCINPYLETGDVKDVFRFIYHHTAGGLFSGSKENMLKYIELFKAKVEQIYNDGWYQIDEAIMTIIQRENRELFEFYYGDYEGIIANYVKPLYSHALILKGCEKTLKHNNTKEAYLIIMYLLGYFSIDFGEFSNTIYDKSRYMELLNSFIYYSVICCYYHNNHELPDPIIDIINKYLDVEDSGMGKLISENMKNINFYTNKSKIKVK